MSSGIGQSALAASVGRATFVSVLVAVPAPAGGASARSCLSQRSFRSRPKPKRFTSMLRIAFWNASLKVRPMAIASPTDFICVVRVSSASGNFSNVQRGIFTTT